MRITGSTRTGTATGSSAARPAATGGAGFVPQAPSGAGATAEVQSTPQVQELAALMALQGINADAGQRRRALRRGHRLLDRLQDLHLALLAGELSPAVIDELDRLLGEAGESGDRDLDAAIEEVELRVRVELAKLGHYPA